MTSTIRNVIAARNSIARAALDGAAQYSYEAIGSADAEVNEMAELVGLPLVRSARSTDDVAVYSDGTRWALVADANGPVAIAEVAS